MREQVKEFFKDEINQFNNFVQQVRNDSTGRFFTSRDGRKNNAVRLGREIFTEDQFIDSIISRIEKDNLLKRVHEDIPTITVLVGPPASGKSTWREANTTDEVVVSRDDTMLQYALDNNFIDGEGYPMNYSEIWKELERDDSAGHKAVDKIEQETFKQAVKDRKSIIIDRTSMSRKSRRKWLNTVPKDYNKRVVVFATEYNEIYNRNTKRKADTGKDIQDWIIGNMMRQFMVPMRDECDVVEWVF